MYYTSVEGERRTFTITAGLEEGYTSPARIHDAEDAYDVFAEWQARRIVMGAIVISGIFTTGIVAYTHPNDRGERESKRENVLRFWGEVSLRRLSDVEDEEIVPVLNDLADTLGTALGQVDVTVSYRDWTWVRTRVDPGSTP